MGGYQAINSNFSDASRRMLMEFTTASASSTGIAFRTGVSSTERMRIGMSGNVGIGTPNPEHKLTVAGTVYAENGYLQGSDIRFKKHIEPIADALTLVQGLEGVRFDWRTEEFSERNFDTERQIGLIAQEVEEVLPELVKTDKEGYKAVSYEKLTAVLVEAIKEQQAMLNDAYEVLKSQQGELARLKAEVDRIKGR